MTEISVIVPVYNAEKTVLRLIKAVLNQTFTDFELFLCDDGSSDDSMALCRYYEKKDSRITVLALDHKGVSSARNAGLEAAAGQYIAFADSDDEPSPEWLSFLLKNMTPNGLSVCGYSCLNSDREVVYGSAKNDNAQIKGLNKSPDEFTSDIFSNKHMYQGYIWNKLFDRDLIECSKSGTLRFDERVHFNEDRLFLCMYLSRCKSVSYSNNPLYNYSLNETPVNYNHEQLTEMLAFLIMFQHLKEQNNRDAMQFADVDARRRALEMYHRVKAAGHPDFFWLKEYIYEHLGSYPVQSDKDGDLKESLLTFLNEKSDEPVGAQS